MKPELLIFPEERLDALCVRQLRSLSVDAVDVSLDVDGCLGVPGELEVDWWRRGTPGELAVVLNESYMMVSNVGSP